MHPLLILNTSIATGLEDHQPVTYTLRRVTADAARALVEHALGEDGGGVLSAIGHESTAQIATEILGRSIPVNRIQAEQQVGQEAIVIKLRGRPPEGVVLGRAEVERIGYDLHVMRREAMTPSAAVAEARERAMWQLELAGVLADLDRCEHARHAGECYEPCPGARGWGNPYLTPGQRIGTGFSGPIVVPDRNISDERRNTPRGEQPPWHDARAWQPRSRRPAATDGA